MPSPRLNFMVLVAAGSIFGFTMGCNPTAPPPPNVGAPLPPVDTKMAELEPGPFLEGRKVFRAHNCIKCHTVGMAPPSKGRMKKSLNTVGADHPRAWIIAHIRDAKTHSPKSSMPAYDTDKISDADMAALADYLTSLK